MRGRPECRGLVQVGRAAGRAWPGGGEFRADRGRPQSSPGAVAGLSNAPGTPRDDGEMAAAGTFLHPFPSESVSDCVDSPPAAASGRRGLAGRPRRGGRGARARP
ncbi:hypothetical protein HPG69_016671 [Diceros bicornis minor]|uniref:Uncharacterized protein n=1 Tax=Diceros bicornis minor TaxID=77932 RepID=A0A7J7EF57_DICBM|nr:hypothetical protein HPG69_016671 [Diceros bicornis minor]